MTADEQAAARLLAEGEGRDVVRALLPGVDLSDQRVQELAAWHRHASDGAGRLTDEYLRVRIMALVDDDSKPCQHCGRGGPLPAKDRARLLLTLARLAGKAR